MIKKYQKFKIPVIFLIVFLSSLIVIQKTKAYLTDTEKILGNSIQIGIWGITPSPPIETTPTPTTEITLTPTPTEIPISTLTPSPSPSPTPTNTPTPTPTSTPTQTPIPNALPWINEIHYDNTSTDTNEGVEIAGPAGMDLNGWVLTLYSGAGGTIYATINLSGVIPNQQNGLGTLWFATVGLQNGAPDGLALVGPTNTVVQFLSYEGAFTATSGPALGIPSIDIGRSETGSEPIGQSLQLQGSGNEYADFVWGGPIAKTDGIINTGQIFN